MGIVLIILAHYNVNIAFAHITKQFGNIRIEIGWSDEPPLEGELNNVIVDINKTTSGSNSSPVINALADMNIVGKYGGLTKPLDFVPAEREGLYKAKLIPTRVGSYSLVLNGTIEQQNIKNAEVSLDQVEGKQKLSFPDSSSSGSTNANNNLGTSLQGTISQLANDIDSTKTSIDTLTKNNANLQKSIQDIKNSADRAYMVGMTGIGAGVAGIIIAAVTLSRKAAIGFG